MAANSANQNIDYEEIARFGAQADHWWDTDGQFKALHEINPVRLAYVLRQAGGLTGKNVLDVGCGGGLLAEAMAAQGARVTGIDMAGPALETARHHALQGHHSIAYHRSSAEDWAEDHGETYDALTCMELVEHVPHPALLVRACARLVRPGGDIFFATVNRTWLSRLLVIWLAEYVFGIVPKGTHTYRKFVRPTELMDAGQTTGLLLRDVSGLRYLPWFKVASLCRSPMINYLMHFRKRP